MVNYSETLEETGRFFGEWKWLGIPVIVIVSLIGSFLAFTFWLQIIFVFLFSSSILIIIYSLRTNIKEKDKKLILVLSALLVMAMSVQVVIMDKQTEIIDRTTLSAKPNLDIWQGHTKDPIPVSITALTNYSFLKIDPKNPNSINPEAIGVGIQLCMRNLAHVELSSVQFEIIENQKFDSSREVIQDLGLDRKCQDIYVKQKDCDKTHINNCNPNNFKSGEVHKLIFEFSGEGEEWHHPIKICTYKEHQSECYDK